ncbi:hypothetical protein BH10BAC4_BH10BAC4_20290 [soil metagenome]
MILVLILFECDLPVDRGLGQFGFYSWIEHSKRAKITSKGDSANDFLTFITVGTCIDQVICFPGAVFLFFKTGTHETTNYQP